jgi:hypothetical protein
MSPARVVPARIVRVRPGDVCRADHWNDLADLAERVEALAEHNRILALDARLRLDRARRFLWVSIALVLADLALLGRSLWMMYA